MTERVILIVLDSVGIGALPDAAEFGDEGSHTLGNIYRARGRLDLPNLRGLGLGNIEGSGLPGVARPAGAYGRMAEVTKAKDTTSGHWELAGLIMDPPFRVFPDGFPDEFLRAWLESCAALSPKGAGAKTDTANSRAADTGAPPYLGNVAASGTEIIERLGAEHMRTGAPIVYTSADSVFQVAAHEGVIPLPKLYAMCKRARAMLTGNLNVGRVIARPFTGSVGAFKRTEHRRDYAEAPPGDTVLTALERRGLTTLGIGKIEDIFCRCGVAHVNHTTNNRDGIEATIGALANNREDAFIFVNLVDFDMLFGHRNDPEGYARALEDFDAALPRILRAMRKTDLLLITADHGCDPTTPSTDHSREYVPVLAYGAGTRAVHLGTRASFADLGATVYAALAGAASGSAGADRWPVGKAFLDRLWQS